MVLSVLVLIIPLANGAFVREKLEYKRTAPAGRDYILTLHEYMNPLQLSDSWHYPIIRVNVADQDLRESVVNKRGRCMADDG